MKSCTELLMEENKNKIGIDVDLDKLPKGYDKNLALLMIYFNILNMFDDIKTELHLHHSASGRGYHFEIYGEDIEKLLPEEKLRIREILEDCSGRLMFSEFRGGDDVLFTTKLVNGKFMHRREISKETFLGLHNERKFPDLDNSFEDRIKYQRELSLKMTDMRVRAKINRPNTMDLTLRDFPEERKIGENKQE